MAKIWIVQLLCPKRHAIAGIMYEKDHDIPGRTERLIREELQRLNARWRCGICGSDKLVFEHAPTKFDTIEEAQVPAIALQEANLRTRQLLDAAGLTVDSQERTQ